MGLYTEKREFVARSYSTILSGSGWDLFSFGSLKNRLETGIILEGIVKAHFQ